MNSFDDRHVEVSATIKGWKNQDYGKP